MSRRSTHRLITFLATLLLISMSSGMVSAETPQKAKKLFEKGAKAYYDGDYSQALIHFRRAYEADQNPTVLYNIALTYSRMGDYEKALEYSREASAMSGMSKKSAAINMARGIGWGRVLSAQDVAEDMPRKATVARMTDEERELTPEELRASVIGRHQAEEKEQVLSGVGWAGISLGAVGAIAGTVGAIYALSVSSDIDALEPPASQNDYDERYLPAFEDLEGDLTVGRVIFFSGLGMTTVGLGLLVWDVWLEEPGGSATLAPTTSGGLTASYRVRF